MRRKGKNVSNVIEDAPNTEYDSEILNICVQFITTEKKLKELADDRSINQSNRSYGYIRILSSRDKWAERKAKYVKYGACMLPDGNYLGEAGKVSELQLAEEKITVSEMKLQDITNELAQVKLDILDAKQTIVRQVRAAVAIQTANGLLLRKLNQAIKDLTPEKLSKLSPIELAKVLNSVTNAIAKGAEMERRALGIDQQPVLLQQNQITYGDDIKSLPTEELIKIVEAEVDNA